MSRLNDLGDILSGYKGRKYERDRDLALSIQEIKDKLCAGGHENHYRAGLLVAKRLPGSGNTIIDVIVPEQDSDVFRTNVKDWGAAVHEAEAIGELAGSVDYVGKLSLDLPEATRISHNILCQRYGVADFNLAINHKNEFKIYSKERP